MITSEEKKLIDALCERLERYTDDDELIENIVLGAALHPDDLRTLMTYIDDNTPPDLEKVLTLSAMLGSMRAGNAKLKREKKVN